MYGLKFYPRFVERYTTP